MTLTLELSPAEERELTATAEKEGVSVKDYIWQRVLPSRKSTEVTETFEQMRARVAAGFAASGLTEEEVYEYGAQVIKQVRSEMRAEENQT